MGELRQNIITREWVIISPERGKRPHEFALTTERALVPEWAEKCPFCPGNESMTSPEVLRVPDGNSWKVRVVPNKFPAVKPNGEPLKKMLGIRRSMTAFGYHEVVIEHPAHNKVPSDYTVDEWVSILKVYRERYAAIRLDKRIEAIVIFQNHGEAAGTSVRHPHSQIVAAPIVPAQVRGRLETATRYHDENSECIFCRSMIEEQQEGTRVILDSPCFLTFIPYAALSPFHTWVFPKRHESSFENITDEEIADLGTHLRSYMLKLKAGLNDPAYNFTIRSIPTHEPSNEYHHWYLTIVPRVNVTAGFELGSGMFINTTLPEESAAFLRNVEV